MKDEVEQQSAGISRRQLLQYAGAATSLAILSSDASGRASQFAKPKAFRFVHLADIHVQPYLRADEGFRRCLQAVHALTPRPEFILTGGDLVMDVAAAPSEAKAKELFNLYTSICRDSDIPIRQCIGNHDVFGWSSKGKIAPDHASYGKKMAQECLNLPRTTYSFDHKGWHFCVVDDILPADGDGWQGGITEEDLDWLSRDLEATGEKPKVLCAHMPIVSATVFRDVNATDRPNIEITKRAMCRNVGPILKFLRRHSVNLVLTGHMHQNETLQLDKTAYVGQGAVCGAWWKGSHHGNPEGFGIIDVRSDGTFEHRYSTFGWKVDV